MKVGFKLIAMIGLSAFVWADEYVKVSNLFINSYKDQEVSYSWSLVLDGKEYSMFQSFPNNVMQSSQISCKKFLAELGHKQISNMKECNDTHILKFIDDKFKYKLVSVDSWRDKSINDLSYMTTYYLKNK